MGVRHRNRSALHVVAGLLLASAVVRLATEAGPAVAQVTDARDAASDMVAQTPSDSGSFLAALQAREIALDEREARIEEKFTILQEAEVALEEKLQAMIVAEQGLKEAIAMAETASSSDVAQLTTVYANMKPPEAAALFEQMSPEFAAGFLGLMRPDVVAAIMSELPADTAYSFSVVLAGRNANVPTQ